TSPVTEESLGYATVAGCRTIVSPHPGPTAIELRRNGLLPNLNRNLTLNLQEPDPRRLAAELSNAPCSSTGRAQLFPPPEPEPSNFASPSAKLEVFQDTL